jgi:hypothetical protein
MAKRAASVVVGYASSCSTVGVGVAWVWSPTLAWGLGLGLRLGASGGWIGILIDIVFSTIILPLRVERIGWMVAARAARASRARRAGGAAAVPVEIPFSVRAGVVASGGPVPQ